MRIELHKGCLTSQYSKSIDEGRGEKEYKQWTLFAGLSQYTDKPTASPDQNSIFQTKKKN